MAKSYIRFLVNGIKRGSSGGNTSDVVSTFTRISKGEFSDNPYICTNVNEGDVLTAELYRNNGKTFRGKVNIEVKQVTALTHGRVEITDSKVTSSIK